MSEAGQADFLRSIRMSSLTALSALRRHIYQHSGTSADDASAALLKIDPDYAQADYVTALQLHSALSPANDFLDWGSSLREVLSVLIKLHDPWWRRLAPYGRQRLATALSTDELQTFRAAGLMQSPPHPDVVSWWDVLAADARAVADEKLTAQGRYAEQLSLAFEKARLKELGIHEVPRWVAVEDNGAGYDVLSFDLTTHGYKNRLIEVKSTQQSQPRMIITRGEWETALKFGSAYYFHLWLLPAETLIIRQAPEMALLVPQNVAGGEWLEAEIILPEVLDS